MPFNGAGVFNRLYTWVVDAANGVKIRADRMDAETDGIATGLSDCVTRDGQSPPTADLPMGGFGHTNIKSATARTMYASAAQIQDGGLTYVAAGGTADVITAAFTPSVPALVDGMVLRVSASAANATTAPTFQADATVAHTVTKFGGQALAAGDIFGAGHKLILQYSATGTRWELLNPSKPVGSLAFTNVSQTFSGTQGFSGNIAVDVVTNRTATRIGITANGQAAGAVVAEFCGADTTFKASICDMDAGGANNAPTAFQIQKTNSSGRSISAAGTINASGADYAEYETKADDCGVIAPGQIVGFNADGKLTDKFSRAISFGIKSTNPAYVGGDAWGNEQAMGIAKPLAPEPDPEPAPIDLIVVDEVGATVVDALVADAPTFQQKLDDFETQMKTFTVAFEAARSKVDRVAYAGKVPVNVMGAAPGQYIIAVAGAGDTIVGKAVAAIALNTVGRVRRIDVDGRAIVAVIQN